jgi:hypothetical protein
MAWVVSAISDYAFVRSRGEMPNKTIPPANLTRKNLVGVGSSDAMMSEAQPPDGWATPPRSAAPAPERPNHFGRDLAHEGFACLCTGPGPVREHCLRALTRTVVQAIRGNPILVRRVKHHPSLASDHRAADDFWRVPEAIWSQPVRTGRSRGPSQRTDWRMPDRTTRSPSATQCAVFCQESRHLWGAVPLVGGTGRSARKKSLFTMDTSTHQGRSTRR